MSPKRFNQHIANLCPVPARAALAVLGLFVALAALAGLFLLLSLGPALAGPAEGTDLPSAEAAPAVSLLLLANGQERSTGRSAMSLLSRTKLL